jgi:hypothetical protein
MAYGMECFHFFGYGAFFVVHSDSYFSRWMFWFLNQKKNPVSVHSEELALLASTPPLFLTQVLSLQDQESISIAFPIEAVRYCRHLTSMLYQSFSEMTQEHKIMFF